QLPKLRDIYAKREQIGEEQYVELTNAILKQRDDILEIVSYGLIDSIDKMLESSRKTFDLLEQVETLTDALEEKVERIAVENGATEAETREIRAERIEAEEDARLKVIKANNGGKSVSAISHMRRIGAPQSFYGKVMTMPFLNPVSHELIGHFPYV